DVIPIHHWAANRGYGRLMIGATVIKVRCKKDHRLPWFAKWYINRQSSLMYGPQLAAPVTSSDPALRSQLARVLCNSPRKFRLGMGIAQVDREQVKASIHEVPVAVDKPGQSQPPSTLMTRVEAETSFRTSAFDPMAMIR
ncbi:MAG: hypothetical protein JWO48_2574, partial [Bryobacterales bacterium]|nr:hypothetical protein [Bryobacterales bacterium]